MCGAGEPSLKNGLGIHLFAFNQSMERMAFYSSDGDMLIVPQMGALEITTEFGILEIEPE